MECVITEIAWPSETLPFQQSVFLHVVCSSSRFAYGPGATGT